MCNIPTCQGYSLTSASSPPTILWALLGTPHLQSPGRVTWLSKMVEGLVTELDLELVTELHLGLVTELDMELLLEVDMELLIGTLTAII